MPTIIATPQPIYGRYIIDINWADKPAVTHASVYRVEADGTSTPVRPTVATNTGGYEQELSGGRAVFYDTEAPLDVALYYTTQSSMDTATATTAPTTVLASDGFWLKDPLRPWADQRVVLEVPQEPDCVPASAIFFQSMDVETREQRSGVFTVNQSRVPNWATRVRGSITSTLTLISRNFVDRDNLIELNSSGNVLFFQGPADYGINDLYIGIGPYAISRLSPDHKVPWRIHVMPFVETSRPAGLAEGVLGTRWIDLCDLGTFGDVTAAGITTIQILYGLAATPPVVTGIRTYADETAEFATYALVIAGGCTYQEMYQGDTC